MVADGNGKGVGGVGRAWRLVEPEKGLDHPLDLALAGRTIPCHGVFHLQGRILSDGDPALDGGQEGHPSHLAELERALRIFRVHEGFDSGHIRLMSANQLGEAAKDVLQAGGERVAR